MLSFDIVFAAVPRQEQQISTLTPQQPVELSSEVYLRLFKVKNPSCLYIG